MKPFKLSQKMNPSEYLEFCESMYSCKPAVPKLEYLKKLLIEEVGEIASLHAKSMRDGYVIAPAALRKELGDVLWAGTMLTPFLARQPLPDKWPGLGITFGVDLETIVSDCKKFNPFLICCELCVLYGYRSEDIANLNVLKLKKRKEENKIHGSGSDR